MTLSQSLRDRQSRLLALDLKNLQQELVGYCMRGRYKMRSRIKGRGEHCLSFRDMYDLEIKPPGP